METQPQGSLLKQLANSLQIASVFSGLYKVAEVILGPRQVGKTTTTLKLLEEHY